MSFRIRGLSPEPFQHLYGLSDKDLHAHGAIRMGYPGAPDRVELVALKEKQTALLVNYMHHPVDNPYRASHAIFVLEGATVPYDEVDTIPDLLRTRTISLRGFDENDMMIRGQVVHGEEPLIEQIRQNFSAPEVRYLHAHYASRGCFAARVDRA